MLKPQQEEKAKSFLRALVRKEKIVQACRNGTFIALEREYILTKRIESLNSPGSAVPREFYEEVERDLSELREVIDLLGLRE